MYKPFAFRWHWQKAFVATSLWRLPHCALILGSGPQIPMCLPGPADHSRPLSVNALSGTGRPSGPCVPCALPKSPPHPGHCGPPNLHPPATPRLPTQRSLYLVYRPFFRQKEFLTESLRLLSSRAGKLLSSKLIISPWPRAPDLALFPGWAVGAGETASSHSGRPFRPVASPLPPGSLARGKTKP